MVQCGEGFRFTVEPRQALGVGRNRRGQDLDGDLPRRFVSVARYTSPIPPTPIWAVTSYGPRRVPRANDTVSRWNYTGSLRRERIRNE